LLEESDESEKYSSSKLFFSKRGITYIYSIRKKIYRYFKIY
jgi:hypothetical protein